MLSAGVQFASVTLAHRPPELGRETVSAVRRETGAGSETKLLFKP